MKFLRSGRKLSSHRDQTVRSTPRPTDTGIGRHGDRIRRMSGTRGAEGTVPSCRDRDHADGLAWPSEIPFIPCLTRCSHRCDTARRAGHQTNQLCSIVAENVRDVSRSRPCFWIISLSRPNRLVIDLRRLPETDCSASPFRRSVHLAPFVVPTSRPKSLVIAIRRKQIRIGLIHSIRMKFA